MSGILILVAAAGCFALKLVGYVVPERALDNPTIHRVTHLIPVAMLSALVVAQVLAGTSVSGQFALLAGVAAAVVALLLRAPFLVVIVVAALVTAGLRAAGWSA